MVDIENYIRQLTGLLRERFAQRLLYVGLQGSYLRGEANENSDIDIMVVIDGLSVADLDAYRAVISSMEHFDKSCGFICSGADLACWNPMEIAHLLGSTKDYYGKLCDLVPEYAEADIRNFVKMSLNNLYHELCHRYIHAGRERSEAALAGTYKGTFFILQNLYLLRHGRFVLSRGELLPLLTGKDREVLSRCMALAEGGAYDFDESFELLFTWCQETLSAL